MVTASKDSRTSKSCKKMFETIENLEPRSASVGFLGIMEKKMEATIMGYIGIIGYILGF